MLAGDGRSGAEAFACSRPGEFAAVLMDLRMPVMEGCEAAQALRALDRTYAQTVPVVAMTAGAFADDVGKCPAAGMNTPI